MNAVDPTGPPPDFNLKYVLWFIFWLHIWDTVGAVQIIFGSVAAAAGGLPHPWGAISIIASGCCTNLLARFKK